MSIPASEEQIFEPFVTTKPKGRGTGLGLAICRDTLATMGGSLEYRRRDPGETVFRVGLALASSDSDRPDRV